MSEPENPELEHPILNQEEEADSVQATSEVAALLPVSNKQTKTPYHGLCH